MTSGRTITLCRGTIHTDACKNYRATGQRSDAQSSSVTATSVRSVPNAATSLQPTLTTSATDCVMIRTTCDQHADHATDCERSHSHTMHDEQTLPSSSIHEKSTQDFADVATAVQRGVGRGWPPTPFASTYCGSTHVTPEQLLGVATQPNVSGASGAFGRCDSWGLLP